MTKGMIDQAVTVSSRVGSCVNAVVAESSMIKYSLECHSDGKLIVPTGTMLMRIRRIFCANKSFWCFRLQHAKWDAPYDADDLILWEWINTFVKVPWSIGLGYEKLTGRFSYQFGVLSFLRLAWFGFRPSGMQPVWTDGLRLCLCEHAMGWIHLDADLSTNWKWATCDLEKPHYYPWRIR